MENFFTAVNNMRIAQKAFFRRRDKLNLQLAIATEMIVDKILIDMIQNVPEIFLGVETDIKKYL
jgi:hypothetical protein